MKSAANTRFGRRSLGVGLLFASVALVGCGPEPTSEAVPTAVETPVAGPTIQAGDPGWVDEERVLAAAAEPGSWLAHGQTYDELRFSRLTDVNR